jgi:uncharacterized protein (TIGR00297 family)
VRLFLPEPDLVVQGLCITFLVGGLARWFGAVSASGFWAGLAVGFWVSLSLGSPGLLVVGTFFVLASGATKWKYREKHRRGVAEPGGGARGAGRVMAKGAIGTALAVAAVFDTYDTVLVRAAFVGAFAAAAADTLGTEVGQVKGKRAFTLIPLRPVKPGTPGAVSLEGTTAALLGAAAVAGAGVWGGFQTTAWLPAVACGGLAGSFVESLAAPLLRRAPASGLLANLVTTASGGAAAAALVALARGWWGSTP